MTSPEKEDNVEYENQEGENIGDGLAQSTAPYED